jgi:hypothetical protein
LNEQPSLVNNMNPSYRLALATLTLVAAHAFAADTIERPLVKEGDKWIYSIQTEELKNNMLAGFTRKHDLSVVRVTSHNLVLASKPSDSNLPPVENVVNLDWSVPRNVAGKELILAQPYKFPLEVGKTWEHDITEPNPTPAIALLRHTWHHTVIGWEDVTVPAGTFKALKIESEGNWYRESNPVAAASRGAIVNVPNATTATVTTQQAYTPPPTGGRVYQVLWYVPEIKRHVKLVYESYSSHGQVTLRRTEQLEAASTK